MTIFADMAASTLRAMNFLIMYHFFNRKNTKSTDLRHYRLFLPMQNLQSNIMKNPWQTLDIQVAYENPWIKITHRNVLTPAGSPGIYGVVHFKNIALAILPLDRDHNTWLVGQYRYTLGEYSWEIPEGGGPIGEDPLDSAKRELLEETGISAQSWMEVGKLHTSNSVTDEKCLIYVAQDLSFGEAEPEETEDLHVRKVPFKEVVEMVMDGEITDALAVAAVLKVHIMIKRGLL